MADDPVQLARERADRVGQSVATLATAELSGTTDAWTSYVELSPAAHIVCNYNLPSGTAAGTITSLSVDVNVRGPN